MNPSPVRPFLSALLWEKTMHYIKVNIIFHLRPVEIAYFQFNHFFLTLSTLCRKCFLTLQANELADNVSVSPLHGQQQESLSLSVTIKWQSWTSKVFARMYKVIFERRP